MKRINIRDANAPLYLYQLRINKINDTLPTNSGNLSMVDNMSIVSNLLLYIKPAKGCVFGVWNPCLINLVLHTKFF